MPAITPGTPLHLLADVFRKAFGDVLSETLASSWSVEIGPEDGAPSGDSIGLSFGLAPSDGLQGNAAFQLRAPDALLLAQKLLKESPDASSELNADRKQAVEGTLRKVTEQVVVALKEQFGEVNLQLSSIDAPTWPGVTVMLVASEASAGTLFLQVRLGNELLAALPAASPDVAMPVPSSDAEAVNLPADSNLDLLLGVDLNLTLRFGQRTLTLREILDLSSGSVIELDRRVQEPADLLLGDKLIARGEVVIVDSNYGLRITEVCDVQHSATESALSAAR